jgi:demethylmenaquinone methyltransferase/2-methoxy-6-polyprenyl-1,4-benzoquinol methylase
MENLIRSSPNPTEIQKMFASIAGKYDRANNFLSAGIHHLWRKKLVQLSGAQFGDHVLDCATGTGDLAIEFKRVVGDAGKVIGSDFCKEMLDFAPAKAAKENFAIQFEVADVTQLPYESESFDISSISFGIRNVGNTVKGIQELHRVLKPGGKLLILEFGQPQSPFFASLYRIYSEKVLPRLGGLITGKKEAYRYLENSSSKFPCREDFLELMNDSAAFEKTSYVSLSGGIAYIYMGTKRSH